MSRLTWPLIALTTLGLLLVASQPRAHAQQPSLAPPVPRSSATSFFNGDFETGDFAGWSLSGTSGIWTTTSTDRHSGNYSAHALLTNVSSYTLSTLTSDLYATTASQAAPLVFWTKAPQLVNGAQLVVQTEWYNINHYQLGSSGWVIRNGPVPEWTKYEIPIIFPANVAFIHVYLAALAYPGDTIEIYVDDIQVANLPRFVARTPTIFLPLVSRP